MRIRDINVDSNQFVDSNVSPDTISIVNNASRRKMNEDVSVLVITANIAKKSTAVNIIGVNNKQQIVEKINGTI